jgi:hypothetical protein
MITNGESRNIGLREEAKEVYFKHDLTIKKVLKEDLENLWKLSVSRLILGPVTS